MPVPQTLPEIEIFAWGLLSKAVIDRHDGFHLLTVVTTDEAREPQARVVVLRKVIFTSRYLYIHTDLRAPKIAHIAAQPITALLCYDPIRRIQLRMQAHASLADQTTTDVQWAAATLSSKRCYLAPRPPGIPSAMHDPNLPLGLKGDNPDAVEALPGRANFAVVGHRVKHLELLHLAAAGHMRASFNYDLFGTLIASTFLTA